MTFEIFEIFDVFPNEDKHDSTKNSKNQNKQSQSREQENKNTIRREADALPVRSFFPNLEKLKLFAKVKTLLAKAIK